MRLSVLDQSVSIAGLGEDAAIRDTLGLAEHCEALGYHRFWLSEHHSLATIVGSAPEILMAAIAARTTSIRIGSAGVMLPHYSALKVAEQFRVLEALAPGRIDLGVGRAPGGDMRTAQALNPNAYMAAEHFPQQVRDLQAWTSLPQHRGIAAHPLGPHAPEVWILGSSDYGAQLAAAFGLPYAFAYFFTDGQGVEQALDIYRKTYQPSERHPTPQATVCVWALAADTEEEALFHALSRERWRVDRGRGVFGPLQAPADVKTRGFAPADLPTVESMRRKAFVGSASQVADKLHALAAELQLDEIVVNTWAHDPQVRRHSYALIAREFELARPASCNAPEPLPCK
jgi:luciferase family oxidoreductase group 1